MQAVLSNLGGSGGLHAMGGIAQPCQPAYTASYPNVICIQNYGAVLPDGFSRTITTVVGHTETYGSTNVPHDPTFRQVDNASFLIWDLPRAAVILGQDPEVQNMFDIDDVPHEGVVYEPNLNILLFSRLRVHPPSQHVIDLNFDPPILRMQTFEPPLVMATGAVYYGGLLYFCASATASGNFASGVYALNATSGKVTPVVNNYFGYNFGLCNDLAVAPNGDIWFTDDWYSFAIPDLRVNDTIQLGPAVYRHVPSSGLTQVVSDAFDQPNGIAFSPDGGTVYISDTDADTLSDEDRTLRYVPWKKRTVYAADVLPLGKGMTNLRAVFMAQDRVPDGVKVSRDGHVVTATGHGVDVLDADGVHILRVQTDFTVLNLCWAGENLMDLWLVGYGKVARVKWALEGKSLV